MKKLLSIIISITLILTAFSGCAKKEPNPAPSQPSASSSQTNTNTEDKTSSNDGEKESTAENNQSTEAGTGEQQNQAEQNTDNQTTASSNSEAGSKNTSKPVKKPSGTVKPVPAPANAESLEDVLSKAVQYMEKNAAAWEYKISDWDAVALRISGNEINKNYMESRSLAIGKEIDNYYMTDYARTILGVMAAGYDPNNFQGINLVEVIKGSQAENGKFKDTLKGGEELVNCHVWSMIALEAAGAEYDRERALEYLEGKQNKDGGFYIFAPYPDSDVDFTAMSIIALTMAGRDFKSSSVSSGLNYMKGKLADMERDPKLQTAETLSVILEAVVSSGSDVNNYKINGKNIAQELLSYKDEAGGFKHIKTGRVNEIATRQAVTALGFYKNNKNMYSSLKFEKGSFYAGENKEVSALKIHRAYYDVKAGKLEFEALTDNLDEVMVEVLGGKDSYTETIKPENGRVKLSKLLSDSEYEIIVKGIKNENVVYINALELERVSEKLEARVRIESYDKNLLDANVETGTTMVFDYDGTAYKQEKVSVYSFVMEALNNMGIKSNVSYSYGAPYISSINDITGGRFGGWDGWMYFVNRIDPGVGMTDAAVKAGDEILVYYGDWGIKPIQITLPEKAYRGQGITVMVKAEDKALENAVVWANGKKYITDAMGITTIAFEEAGSYEVYAEMLDEKGKPLFVRSIKKIIDVR